jgi:hypothetical protein
MYTNYCLLVCRYGWTLVAVHIDYANRAESGKEADFVQQWWVTLTVTELFSSMFLYCTAIMLHW